MDNKRDLIYLGALLHDIGKFFQRADHAGVNKSKLISNEIKGLESVLCPQRQGYYSHKHVLWTAEFISRYEDFFTELAGKQENFPSLLRLAAAHHNPDQGSMPEKIIQKADWCSSGVDRSKDEYTIKDGMAEEKWNTFKKIRLVPVFEGIINETQTYQYSMPVGKIEIGQGFFPAKTSGLSEDPDYVSLWNNFEAEFSKIKSKNLKVFSENLLNLLEKYTSTIPSSTNTLPDVPLFDHSKITAAFAVCLYEYFSEQKREKFELAKDEHSFLLIGGDLSGIQNFIYDIVSKNAAKNLKGRSFYINLLIESVVRLVLKKLELYHANLIYGSGGGFYILAPNTKRVHDELADLEKEIEANIFDTHRTNLYLAIDQIPFGDEVIFGGKIGKLWEQMRKQLDKKKQQRYLKRLTENYSEFFEPRLIDEKQLRDAITGEEIEPGDKIKTIAGDSIVKQSTFKQIQLGKVLRNAKVWVISDEKLLFLPENKWIEPCDLNVHHYFLDPKEVDQHMAKLSEKAHGAMITTFNDTDIIKLIDNNDRNIISTKFYGGNDFPSYDHDETDEDGVKHEEGEPKTFDRLTGEGDLKRLGVLRMDVDNLGAIFAEGFTERNRSFSRLAALSRNMDFFFSGYLNEIWNREPYRNNSFILYSGGDDLFIVGKWDVLTEMAKVIREEFADWTCHNPAISISGGVSIVTGKFPMLKASDMAAEAEHMAKNYQSNGKTKVAFTLLEHALGWQNEFPVVENLKNAFVRALQSENGLPRAFLSNLSKFNENRIHQKRYGKNESWQWQFTYNISRMEGRVKDEDSKSLLKQLKVDVFANTWQGKEHKFNYHSIELANLAARWAEMTLRSNFTEKF